MHGYTGLWVVSEKDKGFLHSNAMFLVNSPQGAFLTWRVPPIWTWQILDFSFPHAHEVYEPVAHGV